MTGCLRIAKESIFTGTNNFVSDTITSSELNEFFGFTQKEVNGMLADVDAEGKADEVKKWYDGYHFGDYELSARYSASSDSQSCRILEEHQ